LGLEYWLLLKLDVLLRVLLKLEERFFWLCLRVQQSVKRTRFFAEALFLNYWELAPEVLLVLFFRKLPLLGKSFTVLLLKFLELYLLPNYLGALFSTIDVTRPLELDS